MVLVLLCNCWLDPPLCHKAAGQENRPIRVICAVYSVEWLVSTSLYTLGNNVSSCLPNPVCVCILVYVCIH